jgi:hypothetical protein
VNVFICWDGDHIGRQVGRAVLSDNVEEVRRVDQAINAGNELWRSFALRAGGSIIEIGGDEGRIEVSAEHLTGVPAIARQYGDTVGATVSVGVAVRMSESAKALLVAKLRGGNQTVVWDEGMQAEIDNATANPQTEKDKLSDEYLNKALDTAPGTATGGAGPAPSSAIQPPKQPKLAPIDPPEQTHAADDFESQLHDLAQKQGMQDDVDEAQGESNMDDVRNKVVETLMTVRQQLPLIQQLQQTAPEIYASIIGLVQGLIALGREVTGSDVGASAATAADATAPDDGTAPVDDDAGEPTAKAWKDVECKDCGKLRGYNPKCDGCQKHKALTGEHDCTGLGGPDECADIDCVHCAQKAELAPGKPVPVVVAPPPTPANAIPNVSGQNAPINRVGTNAHQGGGAEAGRKHIKLPVGTDLDGKVKIVHQNGSAGWKNVLAGMVSGFEDSPLFGANSFPVSSRQPGKS